MNKGKFSLYALLVLCSMCGLASAGYKVGVGRADITGPPVEINFVSAAGTHGEVQEYP